MADEQVNDRRHPVAERAASLREAIRSYCMDRPGITAKEVGTRFGVARPTVQRHLQSIKREWRARDRARALGGSHVE